MTPTVEVDEVAPSSTNTNSHENIPYASESCQGRSPRSTGDVCLSYSLDNNCNDCLVRQELVPSHRLSIPDASPAFRETMGKMKSERAQNLSGHSGNLNVDNAPFAPASPSSPSSPSSSLLSKLKSAFKSTSSSSSHNSAGHSGGSHLTPSSANRSSRRPASFGGADVIKPWTGRRSSQYEKRVSWADELGSSQTLISVRIIKPRLSADTKPGRQTTPGQSILRNSGLH